MEEIREVADEAYSENLTELRQEKAQDDFKKMKEIREVADEAYSENLTELRQEKAQDDFKKMKEIREVAKAYYVNLTKQQQEKAQDEFKKMTSENNKSMSLTDFLDFSLPENYPKSVACSLFKDLDVNRDGSLDFDEFITLFYLHQSKRLLYCRGCETFLNGLYFTCIKCFDSTNNSYDLCSLCYRKKNIQHDHSDAVFLDNYALLRRNIKLSSETAVDPVQENDVVENASNQLEKIANREVANIPARYRKRDRIGKFFARQAANMTSKVVGGISKDPNSIENCSVM